VDVVVDEAGDDEASPEVDQLRVLRNRAVNRGDATAANDDVARERASGPDLSFG
jgi:hypothetical protein